MLRIAVACQEGTANAYYRAVLPATELARRGHVVTASDIDPAVDIGGPPPEWDVFHIHQYISDQDLGLVRWLRRLGIAVVWDSDDDIAAAPRGSAAYKRLGRRRGVSRAFARTVEMANAAHLMTTTNEQLAGVYRDAGVAHVAVIENYLAPNAAPPSRRRHAGVVVGYVAASEHEGDLSKLRIRSALESVLAENAEVRVVGVGVDVGLRDHRYTHYRHVPIERLADLQRGWDIGLAPLVDSRLNRSRSNVKLKEYASSGIAWLASPVGPYVGMGEAQGGVLVADGDWQSAVAMLVQDAEARARLARQGRAWASSQTIVHGAPAWEAAFRTAVVRAQRAAGGGTL